MTPGTYVKMQNGDRGFVLETRADGMALVLGDWDTPLPVAVRLADLEIAEGEAWTTEDADELRGLAVSTLTHSPTPIIKRLARLTLRLLAHVAEARACDVCAAPERDGDVVLVCRACSDKERAAALSGWASTSFGWTGSTTNRAEALEWTQLNLTTTAAALNVDIRFAHSVASKAADIAAGVNEALKNAAEPGWATVGKVESVLRDVLPFLGMSAGPECGAVDMAKSILVQAREMAALVEQAGKTEAHVEMTERALQGEGKALDEAQRELEELRAEVKRLSEILDKRNAEYDLLHAAYTDAERMRATPLRVEIDQIASTIAPRGEGQPSVDVAEVLPEALAAAEMAGVGSEEDPNDRPPGGEVDLASLDTDDDGAPSSEDAISKTIITASPIVTITNGPHKGKRGRVVGPSKFATYARIRFESGSEDDVLRKFVEPTSALLAAERVERKRAEPVEVTPSVLESVTKVLVDGPARRSEIAAATGLSAETVSAALEKLAETGRAVRPTKPGKAAVWTVKGTEES